MKLKLIGISLRRPNFNELTAAAVMATGLWLVALGLLITLHVDIGKADAGALLIVAAWGCVSARLGIRIGQGHRHLLANLVVSATLLLIYQGAWALAG
jgi:hypothetical protein